MKEQCNKKGYGNIKFILDKQLIFPLMDNEEVMKEFEDAYNHIMEKGCYDFKFNFLTMFMLGIIWGKRLERNKKKYIQRV
jgi:hypothetical protein